MTVDRLDKRLRTITISWLVFIGLTAICWACLGGWRVAISGLLLGELGGLYVVFSMFRQGHHNDQMQGTALFASGMVGMFTRLILIVLIMVISLKFRAIFNPYTALIGYVLGFVFVFAGLYGYARNPDSTSQEK
jgi:nitrate/nitrite transporter NarK